MTGAELRQLQADLGLNNRTMCRMLGINETSLCNWKADRRALPGPAVLALNMLAYYRRDIARWAK